MLAQTQLASSDEATKSTRHEVAGFVDFARYFDLLVIGIFAACLTGRKLVENDWKLLGCSWAWMERLIGQRMSKLLRASQAAHTNTASSRDVSNLQREMQETRQAELHDSLGAAGPGSARVIDGPAVGVSQSLLGGSE